MDLNEIRILKEKAEEDVREILVNFMESTNLFVIECLFVNKVNGSTLLLSLAILNAVSPAVISILSLIVS